MRSACGRCVVGQVNRAESDIQERVGGVLTNCPSPSSLDLTPLINADCLTLGPSNQGPHDSRLAKRIDVLLWRVDEANQSLLPRFALYKTSIARSKVLVDPLSIFARMCTRARLIGIVKIILFILNFHLLHITIEINLILYLKWNFYFAFWIFYIR